MLTSSFTRWCCAGVSARGDDATGSRRKLCTHATALRAHRAPAAQHRHRRRQAARRLGARRSHLSCNWALIMATTSMYHKESQANWFYSVEVASPSSNKLLLSYDIRTDQRRFYGAGTRNFAPPQKLFCPDFKYLFEKKWKRPFL